MVLLKSFFDMFCIFECCSNYWIPNDIQKLDTRLQSRLIGQPMAYELILKSVSSHVSNPNPSKSLVLSLHGSTGTGKNFVAKHIVESLYREGYKSKYVRLYAVSHDFMHNDTAHLSQYKDRLTSDIEKITSQCPQAIFVFDELDQMSSQLLDVILYYIDFHTPTSSHPTDFRKTIFIFLSNIGGVSITQLAHSNQLAGIKRENYDILQFQKILSSAALHETGGLQHGSLVDRHLVTFFVPFLPLEPKHIRGCIQQQLRTLLDRDPYEYQFSEEEVIDEVLTLAEFTPLTPTSSEYSVSGCKRISQKLDYVFERIRPTLKKSKKQSEDSDDAMSGKQQQIDSLNSEIQILQKKLDSKTKAFAILINELDTAKHERDQFKSLADSLQEKSVQLKRQMKSKNESLLSLHHSQAVYEHPNDKDSYISTDSKSTIQLLKNALKTVQDEKETLQAKLDELTRELNDVKGDLMIFRQKRHRARVNSNQNHAEASLNVSTKEGKGNDEQQDTLLKRLEQSNERISELDNDLKMLVCQKEELEIERDSFKTKYFKLNQELNKMLNGSEKQVVDIELVLSENRYLKEKMNELTQEKNRALANAAKYKELLQTHRSAYNRLGKVQSTGTVLTHKQVQHLLKQSYLVPGTPETDNDLRSIAEALYENLKDKNMTITHQRKTNKILANRVAELEQLLAETSFVTKSDQTNTLVNLLDPPPPVSEDVTSQFVNSIDEYQQQQTSPTQIFSFSATWSPSPPLSNRVSEDDIMSKVKGLKQHPPASVKSVLACHQSRKTSTKSDSVDLDMDDPLQSPTLTASIAYLEERDLLPLTRRAKSTTEHWTPTLEAHQTVADKLELLTAVTEKSNDRSSGDATSNSTAANLSY